MNFREKDGTPLTFWEIYNANITLLYIMNNLHVLEFHVLFCNKKF